jgi:hypothetical protein
MKKLFFILISIFWITASYAQIGVTSYGTNALGINTSKEKLITGELKAYFSRDIDLMAFELSGLYNFKKSDYHQFSAGIGFSVIPFLGEAMVYSITIPVQLEVFPLQNFKHLSFIIEVAPEYQLDEIFGFQHLWGIRYTFGK